MHTNSWTVRIATLVVTAFATTALFFIAAFHHQRNPLPATASKPAVGTASAVAPTSAARKQDQMDSYGKLPMAFEANQGQTDSEVRYLSRGSGYELFLTEQEAVLTLRQPQPVRAESANGAASVAASRTRRAAQKISVLRMRFAGSNARPAIAGTQPLPGKVSYFIGNDPKKWHTDIPSYQEVRYSGVYPGVDVLFYGRQQHLEYDFVVAPGADPKSIALDIAGARKLGVNSRGDLVMSVAGGKVTLQKPVVYQEVNRQRREIAANYVVSSDHQIRFSIASYDPDQPLTIDPVLNYSTYIGGENFDTAFGIALDAAGDAYIAGATNSTLFPQMNAEAGAPGDLALSTVFVTELNPTGTALLYSTYLGGSGNGSFGEGADAVAVDTASPPNVYVTGYTGSPDFPVSTAVPPFQAKAPASAATGGSAFVTKLTPSLTGTSQLAYSSYLGGDTFDEGHAIAVDGSGNAYIAGETISTNFPTQGTQITAGLTSAAGNAFLTEINTTTTGALIYSTYLGGSGTGSVFLGYGDIANGVTIDANSNAYVVGGTTSIDFPTAGTAIPGSAACGVNTNGSGFISVINTTGGTLGYSHCLSGTTADVAIGVNLGTGVPPVATKVAYITGETKSSNFPITANSIPPAGAVANGVAFVALVNTNSATPLQYSTFLGGTGTDVGYSIASDASGNAYVTGATDSLDFPITQGALQETRNNPSGMVFVAKISPNGQGMADLVYSTYFGGQTVNTLLNADLGLGIALSGSNAYITGQMADPNMLVSSGAFQTSLGGAHATANAFVANLPLVATITVAPNFIAFGTQLVGTATAAQFVTLTNNSPSSITLTLPPTFTGANPADFAQAGGTCVSPLAAAGTCTVGVIFTPSVAAAESATMEIFDGADATGHPLSVALSGTGSNSVAGITFSPTSLTFTGQLLTTTSTGQNVTISNPSTTTALTITAIAASNNDFSIASNSCGNTPINIAAAPGGTPCVLSITFNPPAGTAPGAVTGNLTITDTANGSPQSVPLSGTAWDFSVTGPPSASLKSGVAGMIPITITGLGGFNSSVSLSCTGSANVSSCSIPASSAPGTVNATVTATTAFIVPPGTLRIPPASLRQVVLVLLGFGMLFMIPAARRFRTRLGLAGAMLVFVVVAGCTGTPPPPVSGSITVTGTVGSVSRTATVALSISN